MTKFEPFASSRTLERRRDILADPDAATIDWATAETLAFVRKRAAALPQLFVTSSDKHLGFEELRAEIAGLVR